MAITKSEASRDTAPSPAAPGGGYSATSTVSGEREGGIRFHVTEAKFTQDGDCCGPDDWQSLTVKVEDGGGGKFLVLETDRWALDLDQIPWVAEKLRWLLEGEEELF